MRILMRFMLMLSMLGARWVCGAGEGGREDDIFICFYLFQQV